MRLKLPEISDFSFMTQGTSDMAEGKNKIIVYRDWISSFESLTDEEAGKLIKHFFRYVNDLNPEAPDRITALVFEPIKQTLKRDLKSYESICERNRNNGKSGGRPNKPKKPSGLLINPNNPNKPDSDNDSDNDIKKDINISFDVFWNLYGRKEGNKKICIQRWNKLKDTERQKIIDTLPAFKKKVSDLKYLPYPEKYLNGRRWEDELTVN